MQQLPYQTQNYFVDAKAVGLIVLQTDEVMENELRQWLPDTMHLYHSRIPNDDAITEDSLNAMHAHLPHVTRLLPPVDYDVLVYGCTSGATFIGEQRVSEAIHSVLPDVAVTTPITAVKAQLQHLGAKRIGLLTPYEPHVSQAIQDHLQSAGFDISSAAAFFEKQDKLVCRISEDSIRSAVKTLAATDCDAVFGSCTNLRIAGILDELNRTSGKPVLTSNSALAWHIQQLAA
jgi:maleate isomerase